jgi:glycosyltransferase involved in cell wall biosynthesis
MKSGASRYIDNIVPEIIGAGKHHTFYILKTDKQKFPFENLCARIFESPHQPLLYLFYNCIVLPYILKHNNVEICHGLKFPFRPVFACKYVSTLHSLTLTDQDGHFEIPRGTRIFYRLFGNHSIKKSDAVIAVSNFLSDYAQNILGVDNSRVLTIHHGCSKHFKRFPDSMTASIVEKYCLPKEYLLCVGNVTPVKNFKTVVAAINRLPAEKNVNLVILGGLRHQYAQDLISYVKTIGIENRIFMPGFVSADDLAALMNNASVIVMPSFTEGFPITMIEAMSCGVPIIASRRGGLKELGEGVALFLDDPQNVAELAGLIEKVLNSPELRRQLSNRCLLRAENFSWKSAGEDHLRVYDSLKS